MSYSKFYPNMFPQTTNKEEIYKLVLLAKENNINARNKLIMYNIRLVISIVYNKFSSFSNKEDLISEGVLALYDAIDNYNINYNTKFSTYAYYHILRRIYEYIKKENIKNTVSINQLIEENKINDYQTYFDNTLIQSSNFIDIIEDEIIKEEIINLLNSLNPKEKKYLTYHFGFDDGSYHSIVNTAKKHNITRQYASKTINNALIKIQKKVKSSKC